jgi:hypothetical protein
LLWFGCFSAEFAVIFKPRASDFEQAESWFGLPKAIDGFNFWCKIIMPSQNLLGLDSQSFRKDIYVLLYIRNAIQARAESWTLFRKSLQDHPLMVGGGESTSELKHFLFYVTLDVKVTL